MSARAYNKQGNHPCSFPFLNEAEALAAGPDSTPAQQDEAANSIAVAGHHRAKRDRRALDPTLPQQVIRHELPAAERLCPHDGATLVEIGVETSELLDIIPQQVRVIQHQRGKYACPCCDQSIKVSPAPARLIPKGLLTDSTLAWVVTSKSRCRCTARRPYWGASAGICRATPWPPPRSHRAGQRC